MMILLPSRPLQPPEWWHARHTLAADWTQFGALSTSADQLQHYTLGLGIDGCTAMWRGTSDTAWLDRALLYVENMIATAVPSSALPQSQYLTHATSAALGWARSTDGTEHALYDFYCWRHVSTLLREMTTLTGSYATRRDTICDFLVANIWSKWLARGLGNLYRETMHICAHTALIGLNLQRIPGVPAAVVADAATIQSNIDYAGIPNHVWNGVAPSIERQIQPHALNPGAAFWAAYWPKFQEPEPLGGDSSHASAVLSYLSEAADFGYRSWRSRMHEFVATLDLLWQPPSSVYWGFLGGPATMIDANLNDGWIKLGRYSRRLQQHFEMHAVARNAQLYGNGALNASFNV